MHPSREDAVKKVNELIKGMKVAMLTTEDQNGELHSRPMMTQEVEFDGDVWFFASRDSEKATDIERHPQVNVTYSSGNSFVSLAGKAQVVYDFTKKRELWHEPLRIWFESGPESANVILIKVSAESVEYWDAPSGIVGSVISVVRILLTKDKSAAGETAKVDF